MEILLKEIMKEKRLSVRDVERLTGVSKSNISSIINKRSYPNIRTLEMLAKGLDLKIGDLIKSDFM